MRYPVKVILFLCLVTQLMPVKAQDGPVAMQRYPFVNYERNKIDFYKDSLDFYGFFRKLDRLICTGQGKINIVHFGGSHVQADIWSGRIREDFNMLINQKQAARGFVYPFRLHGKNSNNPSNYKASWTGKWDGCRIISRECYGTYGLSGMESTTYDTASSMTITMTPDYKVQYLFDRVKVFYDMNYQAMTLSVDSLVEVKETIENLQAGYKEFIFTKPLTQVTFNITKTDTLQNHFTLYGFYFDLDAPGINYNAIGVNGASVPSYLKTGGNFERQLAVLKPDLIIFSIGINDAFAPDFSQTWYENNYKQLINRIRQVMPGAAILFTTNTDSYKKRRNKYYKNANGLEVEAAMVNLAGKYGAAVWDLFSVMGGLGSIEFWIRNGMAAHDHIHFNRRGYELMGDLMFTALIRKYEDYLKTPVSKLKHD